MSDTTTARSFSTQQFYGGPGTSAEWIVEAPTLADGVTTGSLGAYSPPVVFSRLGISGAETTLEADTMVQGSVTVSVPSPLTASGFSVSYAGGTLPPAPTPTPTAPPSVQVFTVTAGQQFSLDLSGGSPGLQAEWQVSPDTVSWSALTDVTLDSAGNSTYTFTPARTAYYRTFYPTLARYGSWLIEVIVQQPSPTATPTPSTTAPPSLQSYTVTSGQAFDLTLSGGTPYLQVQWQVSPDDATWTPLITVTLDAAGGSTYTITPVQTAYYRIFIPGSGRYSAWAIEVVVSRAGGSPIPGTTPSPSTPTIPPHSLIVPPRGLTRISMGDWSAGQSVAASGGGSIVHIAATDGSGPVEYYRSLDGGLTFGAPVTLSPAGSSGYEPALAAGGPGIVVCAWAAPTGPGLHGVVVTHSADYGSVWSAPVPLSSGDVRTTGVLVASDGSHRIAVLWVDALSRLTVRISLDGGATFGPTVRLGTVLKGWNAAVAYASGSWLVAWQTPTRVIVTRRSATAAGTSWGSAASLDTPGQDANVYLAVHGSTVVATYDARVGRASRAVVRFSSDGGRHWSLRRFAPDSGASGAALTSTTRVELLEWRLVATRGQLYLLTSATSGHSWSAPVRVSDPLHDALPEGLSVGSRTLVLFANTIALSAPTFEIDLDIARY